MKTFDKFYKEIDEVMSMAARRQRANMMRRMSTRLAIARKRAMKKQASPDILKKRAIKQAVRGGSIDPETSSLFVVYSLATAFSISPMEVYNMPAKLVMELLVLHTEVEKFKAEKMEKEMKKVK